MLTEEIEAYNLSLSLNFVIYIFCYLN